MQLNHVILQKFTKYDLWHEDQDIKIYVSLYTFVIDIVNASYIKKIPTVISINYQQPWINLLVSSYTWALDQYQISLII